VLFPGIVGLRWLSPLGDIPKAVTAVECLPGRPLIELAAIIDTILANRIDDQSFLGAKHAQGLTIKGIGDRAWQDCKLRETEERAVLTEGKMV